jgi:hypothetical protein
LDDDWDIERGLFETTLGGLTLALDGPGSRDWEWLASVVVLPLVVVVFVVRNPRNESKKSSYVPFC